ncbi:hypothetical protein WAX88_20920 (plasmid) [Photobacterium damselae subsp. damselae]|uniref:hypothetical protein n=1 Tax=Photobacterium damselae TaxID=38293 RepID=UPI00311B28C7
MTLKITTQKVDQWKKRVQKTGLKGSTYFCQQGGKVWVSASADHQFICQTVLGPDSGTSSLDSYLRWDNVSSVNIVELLYWLGNDK